MASVEERDRWRSQLLDAIYDAVDGSTMSQVDVRTVGADLGISEQDTMEAAQWLNDHGLTEYKAMGGFIGVTRLGADAVEEERRSRSQQTPIHAAPVHVTVVELREIERFLKDLRAALDRGDGPADPDDRAELEAAQQTVEVQGRSPRPDRSIVHRAMFRIGQLMESAAGNALGAVAFEIAKRLAS